MPNLIVSANVDSFMGSADYAAMRALLGLRAPLTAARTYYVRTDGNDANTGLTNDAAGAFLTWQGAIDTYARSVDHQGYAVTIQAGQAGQAFSIAQSLTIKKAVGTGELILDFNGGTLQNSGSLIDSTANQRCLVEAFGVQGVTLKNGTLTNTAYNTNVAWNVCLRAQGGANVTIDGLNFGPLADAGGFSRHLIAETNGYIFASSNYTISGGGGTSNGDALHYLIRNDGIFFIDDSRTVTLSNNPKFNTFCRVDGGKWIGFATTFSGSLISGATKHNVTGNGVINTFGGNPSTFFPGSVAGSTATGGQFI